MKTVILIVVAFLFIGCSEDAKKEAQKVEAKQIVKEAVTIVEVPVKEEVVAIVEDTKGEVVAVVDEVVTVVKDEIDAKVLYSSCQGCHGANGEKVALGKSKIIKGWDVSKVADALNGYKDGTYGGAMKGLMKGQAAKLNDEEIKAVSDYISKF